MSQVLFSMAVIELAKPGQEAITYELIVSVANAALTVTVVLATQLLAPFHSVTCDCEVDADDGQGASYWRQCGAGDDGGAGGDDDDGSGGGGECLAHQVNTYDKDTYEHTNGPKNFTNYSLVCMAIGIVSLFFFTPFLPRTKQQCAEWKERGVSDFTDLPTCVCISPPHHQMNNEI